MTSPATAPEALSFLPKPRRVWGIALRHIYLYTKSWPRLVEMMYWPMLNMALFGFISLSINHYFGRADMMTDAYLGGIMLEELQTRAVMGIMVMYMEEVWSRNLGHLFASPLRLRDYITSLILLGTTRCLIAVIPAFVAVYFLFGYSILDLGWTLPAYTALLCFSGWWYGLLIVSLLMRFGLAAEWMGWMGVFVLMPFMAPYYPVAVLPHAFQMISWCLPGTYVFEAMREQVATGDIRFDYIAEALALNLIYFLSALVIFFRAFNSAKISGGFMQMGE